jgi:Lrp/AsnC family transcriptional regulator, regulator for asnA, asnC and gidA
MSDEIDALDRRLLHLLGHDAKALASIAEELGVPLASLEERLHALIDRGVISEVAARIAPDRVGLPITAFYFLRVSQNADDTEAFTALVRDIDQVEEAHAVSGQYDWLVKVRAQSVTDVQEILTRRIALLPGFVRGETMIVLSTACDRVNVHAALHETR